jgi:hypothetical protein
LSAFGPRLTEENIRAAVQVLLGAFTQNSDPYQLELTAQAFELLPDKLTDALARTATDSVLAVMKNTQAETLRSQQARPAIESILMAFTQTTNPSTLTQLAQALSAFGSRLTEENIRTLTQLAQALSAFGPRLKEENIRAAVQVLLGAFTQNSDPDQLRLTAQTATDSVLAVVKNTQAEKLRSQARTLYALAAKLTDAQAEVALNSILTAIEDTTDTDTIALVQFAQALRGLALKLTDAQAAFDSILRVINQNPFALPSLAKALPAFTPKLANAQAAIESIVSMMGRTNEASALQSLAEALHLVPATPTEVQVRAATGHILGTINESTSPSMLQSLAQALHALPIKLTNSQAQPIVESLLAVRNRDREDENTLKQAWKALEPKLTQEVWKELQPYFRD